MLRRDALKGALGVAAIPVLGTPCWVRGEFLYIQVRAKAWQSPIWERAVLPESAQSLNWDEATGLKNPDRNAHRTLRRWAPQWLRDRGFEAPDVEDRALSWFTYGSDLEPWSWMSGVELEVSPGPWVEKNGVFLIHEEQEGETHQSFWFCPLERLGSYTRTHGIVLWEAHRRCLDLARGLRKVL